MSRRPDAVAIRPGGPAPSGAAPPGQLPEAHLRVGPLLAEGGEGKVFQLPLMPHLVYKSYRHPLPRDYLDDLVDWPGRLPAPEGLTVRSASAWPTTVVTGERGRAIGLLLPRAPRRFALRHRDGQSRLASLSYLTADPAHRAAAYGLSLPRPAGPERVGLAYALARLLAAFESAEPAVSHGDLSTKNVLWSLQRGPEIFVIDCDNAELFSADGVLVDDPGRRRAMTPNWDDPAVSRGGNPLPESDRYSLALIFLRIVGAANFPIQARQRGGGVVEVGFPVPPGPAAEVLLDPGQVVWDLCARALSLADPSARPTAADWLGPLEALLDAMGASAVMRSVWAAQGGGRPSAANRPPGSPPGDVVMAPVKVSGRPTRSYPMVGASRRYANRVEPIRSRTAGGLQRKPLASRPSPGVVTAGASTAGAGGTSAQGGGPMWPELRAELSRFWRWWLGLHRDAARLSLGEATRGRGARRMALCAVVDFAILVAVVAVLALITSPIVQG